MEDLILLTTSTMEEKILAIIEFVKQVEREHGLSEDEIIYKYTCGACFELSYYIVKGMLKYLYNCSFEKLNACYMVGDRKYIDHHVYLKMKGKTESEDLYFDIFGKKTKQEVDGFMTSDFWKELQNSRDWADVKHNKEFWKGDYVLEACKKHIIAELTTNLCL